MLKFRKDYKLKIVALVVAMAFSVTSTAYGIELSGKNLLRKPLSFSGQENRRVVKAGELIAANERIDTEKKSSQNSVKVFLSNSWKLLTV